MPEIKGHSGCYTVPTSPVSISPARLLPADAISQAGGRLRQFAYVPGRTPSAPETCGVTLRKRPSCRTRVSPFVSTGAVYARTHSTSTFNFARSWMLWKLYEATAATQTGLPCHLVRATRAHSIEVADNNMAMSNLLRIFIGYFSGEHEKLSRSDVHPSDACKRCGWHGGLRNCGCAIEGNTDLNLYAQGAG